MLVSRRAIWCFWVGQYSPLFTKKYVNYSMLWTYVILPGDELNEYTN
ncbi:MAG: hypothetical protein ACI8PG_004207 [Planctomycetota bacterium]|jgi:hypothetical protein